MDPTYDPSWGPDYGVVHPGEYFTAETWIAVTSPTGDFEVEFNPTSVPEPSGLIAASTILLGLAGSIRRKK